MASYKAGTIEIGGGAQVEALVSDSGQWLAVFDTLTYRAETKADLIKQVRAAAKKKTIKARVPFSTISQVGGFKPSVNTGVATGIHGRSGEVLVRWDSDGSAGKIRGYASSALRALSADEKEEWIKLYTAASEARRKLDLFTEARKINLLTEVRAALEAETRMGESA